MAVDSIGAFESAIKENKGKKTLIWVNRRGLYKSLVLK